MNARIFLPPLIAAALSAGSLSAVAQPLAQFIAPPVESHERLAAAEAEVAMYRHRAREALGEWFPTLDVTANAGREEQLTPQGEDSTLSFAEVDLKLTQLLWDFGATNAQVEQARIALTRAEQGLAATRQALIFEAAAAYANLLRTRRVLAFARQSEENIRTQTGLEQARVEVGAGLSTDVLQAKTQLAGAEARRIDAEGKLALAENRFLAAFGFPAEGVTPREADRLKPSLLPGSLEQALELAGLHNPDMKLAHLDIDEARQEVRRARGSAYYPRIEGIVERKWKENVAGTRGHKRETVAKVELKLPINLGFTAFDTVEAALQDLTALGHTAGDTLRGVELAVRDAWRELATARAKARSLRTQAELAEAFLELARRERTLGQRSLIDLLAGETSLINARSDAVSAETDIELAGLSLLKAMGRLGYDAFGDP